MSKSKNKAKYIVEVYLYSSKNRYKLTVDEENWLITPEFELGLEDFTKISGSVIGKPEKHNTLDGNDSSIFRGLDYFAKARSEFNYISTLCWDINHLKKEYRYLLILVILYGTNYKILFAVENGEFMSRTTFYRKYTKALSELNEISEYL